MDCFQIQIYSLKMKIRNVFETYKFAYLKYTKAVQPALEGNHVYAMFQGQGLPR